MKNYKEGVDVVLYQVRARNYNEAMKKARRQAIYRNEVVTRLHLDKRYYEQFGVRDDGTKLYIYRAEKRRR